MGAAGGLGQAVTRSFQESGWKTIGITSNKPSSACQNVVIPKGISLNEKFARIQRELGNTRVHSIINCAGGFAHQNLGAENFLEAAESMLDSSLNSSLICLNLAKSSMNSDGILFLPGAELAEADYTGLLAYGIAKRSLHELVRCFKPNNSTGFAGKVVGYAPAVLDTPSNREAMSRSPSWIDLGLLSRTFIELTGDHGSLVSGNIYKLSQNKDRVEFLPID